MQASDIPTKMPTPFASGAGGAYKRTVPIPSAIGANPSNASFTDGFPPNTFLDVAGGGTGPFGQDMNGLMLAVTQWLRWAQAGGPIKYDGAFSSAVGGYPLGAALQSSASELIWWVSTANNNTTDPDGGSPANWTLMLAPQGPAGGDLAGDYPNPTVVPGAGLYPGQIFEYGGLAAPAGALLCDGASYLAATYPALFSAIGYNFGGAGANFNVPPNGVFFRSFKSGTTGAFGATVANTVQPHVHLNGASVTTGSPSPFAYNWTAADLPGTASSTLHTDSNTPQRQGFSSSSIYNPDHTPASVLETAPIHVPISYCIKT